MTPLTFCRKNSRYATIIIGYIKRKERKGRTYNPIRCVGVGCFEGTHTHAHIQHDLTLVVMMTAVVVTVMAAAVVMVVVHAAEQTVTSHSQG